MATVVSLVNPDDTFGGLRDGYRRAQLGQPNASAGQLPKFRGEVNTPGTAIKAPKILSSAARQDQGTNVTIPYARVTPADELCNVGRVAPGDLLFVHRNAISVTSAVRMNHRQQAQVSVAASMPHARVQRVAGLDYVNRALGQNNYQANHTILVNSLNPADEWRSLRFFNDWTLDGVVLSDDSPGYMLSSGTGARNDRLFNVAIQGPAQVNNGYEDEAGRGIAARNSRDVRLAAGRMGTAGPERQIGMDSQNRPFQGRDSAAMAEIMKNAQSGSDIKDLVAGPFYDQYPLQMFDRKIRPMSELFVGLVCKEISRTDANGDPDLNGASFIESLDPTTFEDYRNPSNGERGSGAKNQNVERIHIFQFIPFSSRQAWQYATDNTGALDRDIVDNSNLARGYAVGGTNESEPASRRRGPNDPKRGRDQDTFIPRKQQTNAYWKEDNFLGLKEIELQNMVGAWRLGRVLDVASSRKEGYSGGPIDSAFRVTLNVDLSFLDWRALRRGLGIPWVGSGALNCLKWDYNLKPDGTYNEDDGRVMQWPTNFEVWQPGKRPDVAFDENIPIAPFDAERLNPPGNAERRGDRMNSNPSSTYGLGGVQSGAVFGATSVDVAAMQDAAAQRRKYIEELQVAFNYSKRQRPSVKDDKGNVSGQHIILDKMRIQAPAAGGSDGSASQAVAPPVSKGTSAPTQPTTAAPASPAPLIGSLSFPEPTAQRNDSNATVDAKAAPKVTTKAPTAMEEGKSDVAPPPPKPASKEKPKEKPKEKRPASGAVGEDVMASIFGSSASSELAESSSAVETADERPKSYPRRNRDR